jgi:hydrogenase maturation protease
MNNIAQNAHIMIMGVGCTLLRDEGIGVKVVHALFNRYDFADNVEILDGATLGVNLLGYMSQADYLIVVDAIRNNGKPGDLYRLAGQQIPERIRAKNSLHQVDFLEALTLCQALDRVPEVVILGVEPEDIDTCSVELTPVVAAKFEALQAMVLEELDRLGAAYSIKAESDNDVSCDTL